MPLWKLNQFISGDDGEREEGFLEEESDGYCSFSPTQRMYAFAASLIAGLALMFLGIYDGQVVRICRSHGF